MEALEFFFRLNWDENINLNSISEIDFLYLLDLIWRKGGKPNLRAGRGIAKEKQRKAKEKQRKAKEKQSKSKEKAKKKQRIAKKSKEKAESCKFRAGRGIAKKGKE